MASLVPPKYELVADWEKLPEGMKHLDCVGAGIDPQDRVYVITRSDARVLVYERDGSFVTSWGEGIFTPRTHCIRFGADGAVYTADDGDHTIRKFSPDGDLLLTLGVPGVASDTGYDSSLPSSYEKLASIKRGGPPFNRPTGVSIAPSGEIYVCDGYANARVHRFSADGKLIQSWGEPGIGPGQFNLPHDVLVLADGQVLVADRENDRVQFFSPSGEFLRQWTHVQRPTGLSTDGEGRIYVSELWWRVGQRSFVHGPIREDMPGRVSILSPDGEVLTRWGGPNRTEPGMFIAPHGIAVDSEGSIYVAEVTHTFGVKPGAIPEGPHHTFQKFLRVS